MKKYSIIVLISVILVSAILVYKQFEFTGKKVKALESSKQELMTALQQKEERITQLDAQIAEAQGTVGQLNAQVAQIQNENAQLKAQVGQINAELVKVSQEKQQLEVRLNSLDQLKLAIHDIKQKLWQAKVAAQAKIDAAELAVGNHGFLVREGKSTHPARVKVDVRIPPQGN